LSAPRRLELVKRKGVAKIVKIRHGSPAHVCGQCAVGDELVAIDGFAVEDTEVFTQRAAAGAMHSLVKLQLRHPQSASPDAVHSIVVQRTESFEAPPLFYVEPTNASINLQRKWRAPVPQAGLGIVVVSSNGVVKIAEIPPGSAAHVRYAARGVTGRNRGRVTADCADSDCSIFGSRVLLKGDSILQVDDKNLDGLAFDDIVKSFVGPLSSRVYLTIVRGGERSTVAVVRHNRLTTQHAHAALCALHERLSALTVCVDITASAPVGDSERSRPTGGEEGESGLAALGQAASGLAASEALGLDLSRAANGEWQVTNVHSGGPAADAGLAVGNIVQEADDKGITGKKAFDVVWLLDGPAAPECAHLRVLSRYELCVCGVQRGFQEARKHRPCVSKVIHMSVNLPQPLQERGQRAARVPRQSAATRLPQALHPCILRYLAGSSCCGGGRRRG